MADAPKRKSSRRTFLKRAAAATAGAAAVGGAGVWLGSVSRVSRAAGKKVIVIGIDGMDPRLSQSMMAEGLLPNLVKLRDAGGFSSLGTSMPPQSPVAWANFINGAGPGSHGIFDFIHRHPHEQCSEPFYSAAETLPGAGGINIGDHKLQLDFWPFNHKLPSTVLRRQGTPFWDYLDKAGVPSTFYDLPSNYPASPSKYGHHRCICGMGTPDVLGDYGTYQYFFEKAPNEAPSQNGGKHAQVVFKNGTAKLLIQGPDNSTLKEPEAARVEVLVHRDPGTSTVALEVHGQRILLKPGEWSGWTQLNYELGAPWFMRGLSVWKDKTVTGICRFYLQEAAPNFRLYVSPININPADPAVPISEPASFITDVASQLGPFYTTGFQEDYNARKDRVFNDDEYLRQANMVLEERINLLDYAIKNYDDGLLFFYFSSGDLQSHMFWWSPDEPYNPDRDPQEAASRNQHVRRLYQRLDTVIGDLNDRYGSHATIIVMSDHGFANFGWQFNLNSWLRDRDYLHPFECTTIKGPNADVDWSQTAAYGLGINGLYLNLKGRERDGAVEPAEADGLLTRLTRELKELRGPGDVPIIRNVYRASQIYGAGPATKLAPDLIVGYHRGFRASWTTCLGGLDEDALSKNEDAWSADHCADALEVPGVLWSNRPIRGENPRLIDMAPSILAEYGLQTPPDMTGRNVLGD